MKNMSCKSLEERSSTDTVGRSVSLQVAKMVPMAKMRGQQFEVRRQVYWQSSFLSRTSSKRGSMPASSHILQDSSSLLRQLKCQLKKTCSSLLSEEMARTGKWAAMVNQEEMETTASVPLT